MLRFREGFPYLDICRAAVAGDGILQADGAAAERYGAVYRELRPQRKVVKFVPASGAATRMFKALFEFLNDGVRSREVDELLAGLDVSLLPNGLRSLPEAAAIREPWSRIS